MQNNAAVFRTQESLEEGCKLIDETMASFQDVKVCVAAPHVFVLCAKNETKALVFCVCGARVHGIPWRCGWCVAYSYSRIGVPWDS